jgi:hypothetical protein
MNLKRRIALGFVRHALSVMPARRRFWAAGMANEIEHIDDSGSALKWGLGAMSTAYLELATSIFGAGPVRVLLALPVLFAASQAIFAQCLTLAWRMRASAYTEAAGSLTPGDDYRRFIPLMQMAPDWYLVAGFVAGALIVIAAVQLIRKRPSAPWFFVAGMAVETLNEGAFHLLPGYREAAQQVWHFTNANPMRDVWIPLAGYLLPIFLAVALWLAVRGSREIREGDSAA